MNRIDIELTGWGRNRRSVAHVSRPERPRDVEAGFLAAGEGGVLARGAGRAYGDAALNGGGDVLLTERLDRILSFDPATGAIVCEPGVTFADLIKVFLPRGFMAPSSPGTAFATIGGAVAADVHGKNHDRDGGFGDHVEWFDLLMSDGATRRVTAENDAELFAATIGGMGLTGILRAVAFRLLPASEMVAVRERRMRDLDAFIAGLVEARAQSTFSVGWIDALARGAALGRGVLETAEFAPGLESIRPRRARRTPFDFPGFALNNLSVKLFNEAYYRRIPEQGRSRRRRLAEFLYPLDSLHDWNRIYGKRGFYQFQCVVPDATAPTALRALLETVSNSGGASFLAVLKTLGREGRGHLSFPLRGFTLALDFPRKTGTEDLLHKLEWLTLSHGGRIYLAKDSLLGPDSFRGMYSNAGRFESVLARVDPRGRFTSDQARRLGLKPHVLAPDSGGSPS